MHPFQENLQTWLFRKHAGSAQNHCAEIPLIIATDIGLVRTENQDRAAALYTGRKSTNPLLVIAVADGMGGMRDGGLCANLALSSFFHSIVQYRNLDIRNRANEAIKEANNQVFEIYKGTGGSTLTALLLDSNGTKIIAHLGDTRIYSFGPNKKVERHTTDDSLAEAVGGSGRELLQFVGMGESMHPKISEFTSEDGLCAITTDGIHGIEEKTLNKILENSENIEQASERLNAVSRWCGGIDNATSAIFDVTQITTAITNYEGSGIRVWDSGGDLTTLWLREEQAFIAKQTRNFESDKAKNPSQYKPPLPHTPTTGKTVKKPRSSTSRSKSKKQDSGYTDKIQLDIEIGN